MVCPYDQNPNLNLVNPCFQRLPYDQYTLPPPSRVCQPPSRCAPNAGGERSVKANRAAGLSAGVAGESALIQLCRPRGKVGGPLRVIISVRGACLHCLRRAFTPNHHRLRWFSSVMYRKRWTWWAGSSRLRVLPSGVQPAVWWRKILLVLVFFPLVDNYVFFCGKRCCWPGWDYPSLFRLNETFSEMKRLVLSFPPGSCRRSCSLRIPPGKRNNKTPLFQNMAHFHCLLMKNAFLLLLPFGCKGVCRSKRFVSVKKKKMKQKMLVRRWTQVFLCDILKSALRTLTPLIRGICCQI